MGGSFGGQPGGGRLERRKENEDLSPVAGLLVMCCGGLGFWWWQLGEEGRRGLLGWVGREGGYGEAPADMLEQVEWLLMHRMEDLLGMSFLFLLTMAAGLVEGNARRQAEVLGGFGLRRLRAARALVLVWLCLAGLTLAAPVALPFREVALGLAGLLLVAMYMVGRGLRRVQ